MTPTAQPRPLRADARRNRERLLDAARELLAERGVDTQVEEIAARAGVGMGTLYRHFGSKRALLTRLVADRFGQLADLAEDCERTPDPGTAFEAIARGYLDSASQDAAFLLALVGTTDFDWESLEADKRRWTDALARVIARAVESGDVRAELTVEDFRLGFGGMLAAAYLRHESAEDRERHLTLLLDGVRARR